MAPEKFDPLKIRESLNPPMRRLEMARRMGISGTYLRELEMMILVKVWPDHRKRDFLRIAAEWKKNPNPSKHWGRRKGHRADGTPVPPKRVLAVA